MQTQRFNYWQLLLYTCVVIFLLAGCTATSPSAAPTAAVSGKPTIKFIVNSWIGSEVNVEVARYLIEQKLGYPTDIIRTDESVQWDTLAKGKAHAVLEIWPSGRAKDIQKYIVDDKSVIRGSALGVTGKIGWYIPSYMVKAHPQLATWKGFLDPANAALFATDASGGKGQFLAGSPTWVQYDSDIIKNLGLPLQVVRVADQQDPEASVLAEVDKAYKAQKPILFYFWTPHWAYILYDLTEVKLPDYSDQCYAKAASGGVDCDYPTDVLFKAYSTGLKAMAPDVYQFLEKFNYTNQDQISMLAQVQLQKKSPHDAAVAWVNEHEAVWKQWLP